MPPLERTDLPHAIVWFPNAYVDAYGQWQFGAPQEIKGRWNWKRSIIQDRQGNNIMLDATVVLGQDATNGDLMWKGTLDDWNYAITDAGSGQTPSELMQVKSEDWTADIKGRNIRREYGLMRYRESAS